MKLVYFFGSTLDNQNWTEGSKEMIDLLGGKGAGLAEMARMFANVPQGFTISTEACERYVLNGEQGIDEVTTKQIIHNLDKLETATRTVFGKESVESDRKILLVSVRSGARVSMPGMMDTVLNVGLNDKIVELFAQQTNNPRLAYDCYRRLLQMFSDVVLRVDHEKFEHLLTQIKQEKDVQFDSQLAAEDLKVLCERYKALVKQETGSDFPQDPNTQLFMAAEAVFKSFNNKRAKEYRKLNNISNLHGTAVNIQRMVFGNMNDKSGTGVAFSRNPSTGVKKLYGEFLVNAQGEDVVAGIRTPQDISKLQEQFPECFAQLEQCSFSLEQGYRDLQDMEFTIEDGAFYMLQCRSGKRTAFAAVKAAVDMVNEGLIDERTALLRIDPAGLDQLLHRTFDEAAKKNNTLIAKGIAASPGAAVGVIAFNSDQVKEYSEKKIPCILVRSETSTEDVIAMNISEGVLTKHGGKTSHAAVVARGMGKPCVSGCTQLSVDEANELLIVQDVARLTKGDYVSIDGTTGEVFVGKVRTSEYTLNESLQVLLSMEKKYRKLGVRVNGETVQDCMNAELFGADGIGLARTEHMFFEKERVRFMREAILAKDDEERKEALQKVKPYQRQDFVDMFKIIRGKPLTMRLLDPPLHEYLPTSEAAIKELALDLNISVEQVKEKINLLKEANPLIGHRGCRVGIHYPDITTIQVEAILEAAVQVADETNIPTSVEIMVPMVSYYTELQNQKNIIIQISERILGARKADATKVTLEIGTMIETPRACLTADKLAQEVQFFSVGSNDLTALTFGYSRDDAPHWIPMYLEKNILPSDPFTNLDIEGVGEFIKLALTKARLVKPNFKVGICGEVGGDPDSISFFTDIGLNYVSVSPFRVPTARLAACQAALKQMIHAENLSHKL